MDYELKNKLVKIISKNILTPVIYMILYVFVIEI